MYPAEITAPMAAQLANAGFEELKTPAAVDEVLSQQSGTTLLVVNSVCGCAAGSARPGILASLQGDFQPDRKVTVFAGVDIEATKKAREYLLPYPPSSPSVALFKDGQLVHIIERHHIEARHPALIAANLQAAYQEYCKD
ncbi:MAG: BrxA/BrxB family bacilliredoxin [Bacteroidia bacterium]|nr:BrxA/BrxB family bacilliredoxin [Bacteroidia bacterium]